MGLSLLFFISFVVVHKFFILDFVWLGIYDENKLIIYGKFTKLHHF